MKKLFTFLLALGSCILIFGQTVEVVTNPTSPWTVPAGVTSVKVECWGGGGGGGGSNSTAGTRYGGGGGGGGYSVATYTVSAGQTYTITRGAGGTVGSNADGGAGGTTTFTGTAGTLTAGGGGPGLRYLSTPRAGGGAAGVGNTWNGGAGGTGSGNGAGGGGGAGNNGNGTAGANATTGTGGAGNPNSAPYKGGNGGAYRSSNGDGNSGSAPGGGGGGARSYLGNRPGGAGAPGQVVLTYTLPAPPATPGTPTSNSPQCNSVTITRNGTPPAGEIWYWQTSSSGTATTSSGATYSASSSGTYYIRSKRTSDGVWSSAASIAVVVNTVPAAVTTPSPANGATGVCYAGVGAVSSISWAASATATSYDVYFGTASNPPLVSTSQAGVSYNTGALSANTTYYCKVIAKNGCGSASATSWSFTTSPAICYCASGATSTSYGYIARVRFNTIDQSSSNCIGYTDNSSISTSVNQNSTHNLIVNLGNCSGIYSHVIRAWIDWNANGVFEASEIVGTSGTGISGSGGSYTASVTIPATAVVNTPLRMRVTAMESSSAPTECQSYSWGETEDYTVSIVQPDYAAQYISQSTGSSTWCAGETRTVSVTIKNTGLLDWTDGGGEDFNIGVKWNGEPDYIVRVDAQNLASGATVTYNLTVTAPAAGADNLTFNVVQEGQAWFGGPYASPAITVNALPTSVNAGSDVAICNGGSTQLSGSAVALASSATSYEFTTDNGVSLENLSIPTATPLGTAQDDASSGLITIPFTFNFAGTNYTQTSFSSNGLLTFGGTVVSSSNQGSDNLTSGLTPMPLIAPWWDDCHTGSNGNVRYKTIGSTPNRKFVVEWNFRTYSIESGNYTKTVQVWLFETSNILQFVYGAGTSVTYSNGAQIGIASSIASYQGINTSNHTASTSTNNNGQTSWPGNGRTYVFTPIVSYSWSPATGLSATNVPNPIASPSSTTTYTMTATANGCSATDEVIVSLNTSSTAPTSISGTSNICNGGSTTLTASGGTNGTGAINVWYEGACVTEAYNQQWASPPASVSNTIINSCTGGILNVTSTTPPDGNDPMIHMYSIGSFDPLVFKYINVRYRVVSGTAGSCEIFFNNPTYPAPAGPDRVAGALISDNNWHILSLDMSTNQYWDDGNITGWRFDWATASGVTMEIDYITLTDKPIIGEGNTISVSPTSTTTYYTAKKGECNTTSCASKTVTVNNPPTAPTSITGTTTICSGSTTTLSASGGSEGSGCTYQWGTGSSVGSNVIAGETSSSYTTPALSSNTTYWVRRVGISPCSNTTTGVTQLVTINSPPTAPISITGISSINQGESTTLTASGGSEGSGCTYEWFESACGSGVSLGSNNSIDVTPLLTTTYYVRRVGTAPCSNTTSCAEITVNVAAAVSNWTGALNTDWNTAGNWNPNGVPNETKDVVIPNVTNKPIIGNGTNAEANNIMVNTNSSITINNGGKLTCHANLTNNGTINIKSTATGDGSLITNSRSGSGTYKVERYLAANKWHLISSPITNAMSGIFTGIWLRPYNETTNQFGEYIVPTNIPLTVGQGFSNWTYSNETRTFSGTVNNGTVGPIDLPRTNLGWNLIGNPYPSAIDWNAASGWNKNNVANSVYVWNNNQYATYINGVGANDGSEFIAMGQGFFVQALPGGGSIAMNNNVRVHSDVGFMKNSDPANIIRVKVATNENSDESVIAIRSNVMDEFDYQFDATKLRGDASAPQLYTKKADTEAVICAYSDLFKVFGQFVYFEPAEYAEHVLIYTHTIDEPGVPVLFDHLTGATIYPNVPYTFTPTTQNISKRFEFIKASTTGVEENSSADVMVWESDKKLHINNLGNEILKEVRVYDIQGKLVFSGNQHISSLSHLTTAPYVVHVVTSQQTIIRKIVLR